MTVQTTVFGKPVEVESDWRRQRRGPQRQPRRDGTRSHTVGLATLSVIAQLVDARHQAGMTQAQVAAAMGVTQAKISDFENARNDPALGRVLQYANAVGINALAVPSRDETNNADVTPAVKTGTKTAQRRNQTAKRGHTT